MNKNIKDILPLTPMQQGMLFHSLLNPETEVYTEQLTCKIKGKLNVEAFKKAWSNVYNNNDALKASFLWEDLDEPLQVIYKEVNPHFEVFDWSKKNDDELKNKIEELTISERKEGFKLNKAPLTKFKLIYINDNEYYFIWSYHHLLFDGWSTPIVFKSFLDNYHSIITGQPIQTKAVRAYRDFIAYLKKQDKDTQKNFWQKYLKGFEAPNKLPYSKFGVEEKGYTKERRSFSPELSQKVHSFSKEHNITLNTIIQAAWSLLLSKYNSENDILFGVTVSGRSADLEGIENIVGLFINTIPLRVKIENKKIIDWLKNIQVTFSEVLQYEHTPLVDIHKWSEIPGTEEMFKSILVVENYPVDESIQKAESELQIENLKTIEKTNYPLTLVASPGKTIAFDLAYQTEHFDKETILRLLEQMEIIINGFISNSEKLLKNLSILTSDEKTKLRVWNKTEKPLPKYLLIHKWFENVAKNNPDKIALEFENKELCYSELNNKANQLASYLIKQNVKVEDIIGVCVDKSFEMVIASLAVLKVGAAFVPLDPTYPPERLNYIAHDANVKMLITTNNNDEIFQNKNIPVVNIDNLKREIGNNDKGNIELNLYEENLAYIIYTSGSTGKPKGVMLQHKGFCNLMAQMHNDFSVHNDSSVLQLASYSFDASVAEIFMPLLIGAKLSIIKKELAIDPDKLIDYMNKKDVTHATLPPSLLAIIDEKKIFKGKTFVSVGDSCSWDIANRFGDVVRFLNGYGPTEASVGTTWDVVNQSYKYNSLTAPIGHPIGNSKVYLLDINLQQVPVGGIGEIFIGGIGLARGYFNRPDLTAEKFLPDPFTDIKGSRMYRTGDTARYLNDGTIEFIGRVDYQVKIRGFRIELGEIEAQINSLPNVKNSVVIASKDNSGNERLIAYFISDEKNIDAEKLKNKLREKLPEYMIPYAIVLLDEFPLTPNGKIDRKNLPLPDTLNDNEITAMPRNTNEEIIANIWKDILKINQIGIKQNFFEIGGHSLLATQVVSRINESFNIQLPIKYIFEYPTIASLSKEIEKYKSNGTNNLPTITKVNRDINLPLSFSQKRLWFLNELKPNDPSYNITSAFKISGNLNIEILSESIKLIIQRHEILRTVFIDNHGQPAQKILDEINFEIKVKDFTNLSEKEAETKAKEIAFNEGRVVFNLAKGPLLKSTLIKLNDSNSIMVFTIHHIIADGWSIPILIKEIAEYYNSIKTNNNVEIKELPIQYADYAYWQNLYLESDNYKTQLEYWKNQLAGIPPLLELPLDKPRPSVQTFNGNKISFTIEPELTSALNKISQKENVTLYMTMLSAFQLLLSKYSNQKDIVIGTPIAGRNKKELENLIGFFVNNLVIRTTFDNKLTFRKLLKQVRETSLDAYANQDLPFEKLVEELQPERDMSHAPIFQVMFVFQNIPFDSAAINDIQLKPIEIETGTTTFDLSLTLSEVGNSISAIFEYNTDLFYEETIKRFIRHYKILLTLLVKNVKQKISKIELITKEEKSKLNELNKTEKEFGTDFTVDNKFEKIVVENPNNIALRFSDPLKNTNKKFTYKDLDKRSNQLANYIIQKGLAIEDCVGICLDRSLNLHTAVFAVLKAGGAFLPIDPYYPVERINYMIKDSNSKFIITTKDLERKLFQDRNEKLILIDELDFENLSDEKPDVKIESDNLAYIIYTSGSTGLPKGTMLPHKGLCNLSSVQREAFEITTGSNIMQFSSLSFDASVWETVMALLNSASLQLTSKDIISSGSELSKLLESEKITTITLPPSVLSVLEYNELPELKTIITAGEAVSNELVSKWSKGRKFFNAYGPTETTVCASMFLCNEKSYPKGPPIGKPISNFRLYIIDENFNLVPEGVPGELCIGGIGLARGYLGKPDITADKFVPDNFSDIKGERIYRTGDLARYLPDGNIEFLGRIDQQVKVRGFRIELGEIDAQIRKLDSVVDATVIVRENSNSEKQIIAYLVLNDDTELDIQLFRNKLSKVLPDYMIPAAFVKLDKIPLTPNGKVDKAALPKPELSAMDLGVEYVEPRNEVETKLVKIAQELLSAEKIGVLDNFFMLGGHSLLATQFISYIREAFNIDLPLRQIFETPTIEGIAIAVNKAIKNKENKKLQPGIKRISRDTMKINRKDIS